MLIRYPLVFTPDDNDTLLVTCPDLPEVTSFGETETDALQYGAGAVAEAVAGRLADFEDIPRPSEGQNAVPLDLQLSLKVMLAWALREDGLTRADLMRRLGGHRPQVDRLFDPNHAARLDRYEAAFAALGRRVGLEIVPEPALAPAQ
jgi:antitoxin HicB